MINFNGNLIDKNEFCLSEQNRVFKYGDGIFDTIKYKDNELCFLEDHYFRLMSSMRMLRMKIPMNFTLDFYQNQIMKVINRLETEAPARIRVTVYRVDGGLYTPLSNEINFLIEGRTLVLKEYSVYEIELFKDFPIASGLLSTIKTSNKLINVLSSIYADENKYQNCILINEKKHVVEGNNANIFLIKGKVIRTPSLASGCVNGIIRKKLIEVIRKNKEFDLQEDAISTFELLKADEVFLTNSISEFQSVDTYRKKSYAKHTTSLLKEIFKSEYGLI